MFDIIQIIIFIESIAIIILSKCHLNSFQKIKNNYHLTKIMNKKDIKRKTIICDIYRHIYFIFIVKIVKIVEEI